MRFFRHFFSFKPLPSTAVCLWLVLLGMAARLSIFVRRRAYGDFSSIDRMALMEILLMFATLALIASSKRLDKVLRAGAGQGLFFYSLALGMSICSALWSPIPAYSGYRALAMASQFMGVMIVFSYESDFFAAERRFLMVSALVLLMQMIERGGWLGFWMAPMIKNNTLATSAAMIASYCLGEYWSPLLRDQERRRNLLFLGVWAFLCVALGTSAASNIALLSGLALALILLRRADLLGYLALAALFLMLLAVPMETLKAKVFPGKSEEQIRTMTGRTMLWEMYFERIKNNLWIGEGYAATARVADFYTTNTHNAFIAFLAGTGIIGCLLYVFGLLGVANAAFKKVLRKNTGAIGASAALLAGLVNCNSKAFLGEGYYPETLVFFSLFALVTLQIGREK